MSHSLLQRKPSCPLTSTTHHAILHSQAKLCQNIPINGNVDIPITSGANIADNLSLVDNPKLPTSNTSPVLPQNNPSPAPLNINNPLTTTPSSVTRRNTRNQFICLIRSSYPPAHALLSLSIASPVSLFFEVIPVQNRTPPPSTPPSSLHSTLTASVALKEPGREVLAKTASPR